MKNVPAKDTNRMRFVLLGRVIGTASGWDGEETGINLYDFEPAIGVPIPPMPTLSVEWEQGWFQQYDDDGKLIWNADIMLTLSGVPRVNE